MLIGLMRLKPRRYRFSEKNKHQSEKKKNTFQKANGSFSGIFIVSTPRIKKKFGLSHRKT